MTDSRLSDYLAHIQQAATDACYFIEGQKLDDFIADKRTQQAVILNLVIIGEAATKLLQHHSEFLARHTDVPWSSMKGMRNRLAHCYFDIDLEVVWETVSHALPSLLESMPMVLADAHKVSGNAT